VPTPARLKLLQACDQWYSSRVSTLLTISHCKSRPNTEGTKLKGKYGGGPSSSGDGGGVGVGALSPAPTGNPHSLSGKIHRAKMNGTVLAFGEHACCAREYY
jgi:hypothetical protein